MKTKEELQIEINQLEAKISELEKSELKYNLWIENSPVCTKILDLDFNLQYMSNAGVEGLKIDDITAYYGKPYPLTFYSESFKIPMTEDLKRAKETGETRTHETTIQDMAGNTLWFHSTVIPIKNNKGQIDHFMIVSIDTTFRKHAEDELNMSKVTMERTEEIAKLGGWSIDIKTMTPYFSKELLEIYELDPPIIPAIEEGIKYYAFEDRPKIEQAVQDCMKTGKPYDLELRFITAKGNKRWVRTIGKAETKDENIVKISGILQDITEKKNTQQTLKDNEEQLEKLFIGITDGFALCEMIFDAHAKPVDYRFLKINPAFEFLTGLMIKSTLGKTVTEIYPDIEKDWIDKYGSMVIHQESVQFEDYNHNTNKHYRVKAFPTTKNEFAMLFEDITDKKVAEKALLESETRFKALHNASFGGIAIHDNGLILECNRGLAEMFGYTADELIGMNGFKLIAKESLAMVKENILNEYEKPYEGIGINKKGNKFPIRLEAKMIPYKGQMARVVEFRDITEWKETEKKLIASEEKFRMLANNSVDVIWQMDLRLKFTYISPNVIEMFGYTQEEWIGTSLSMHSSRKEFFNMARNALIGLKNYKSVKHIVFESKMMNKNGDEIPVEITGRIILDDRGLPTYLQGSTRNITNRKQDEQKILNSYEKVSRAEERFEMAMNATKDGLFDWDLVTNVIYYSPGWKSMLGYKEEELAKDISVWEKLTEPQDVEATWKVVKKLINKKIDKFEIEFKMRHKDGHWVDILSRADAVFNDKDKAIRIIGTHVDISERKVFEQEIIKTKQFYENITEGVQDGIWVTNEKDVIYYANSAMEKIAGVPRKQIHGNHVLSDFPEETTGAIISFYKEAKRKKQPVWYEIKVKTPTSRNTFQNGWLIPQYQNERFIGVICTTRDVTVQKQAESELNNALKKALESDKLKSAFLANMSHEIRTPMNGILGFSNLLKKPGLSGEQQQQYIEIIEKSGARMLNTIHDIIDISKIEAGEMLVSTTNTSVNNLMGELYSFYSDEAKMKGLSLYSEPSLSHEQAMITTDSQKLHGILNNLLKNSIKYTDKGSIVFGYNLRNKKKNAELEFFVKDSGIGIPKNRLHSIFNRFEQADISDSRAFQGSGLGLAISKAYVEMLGGRINVESEEGKGSKFTFTIPYITKAKNKLEQPPESIHKEPIRTHKLTLLIVEDEEVSSELLKAMLKGMFQKIIVKRTGTDAIETCKNNPEIDLVLMDIKMPLMDGYEATRQIRKFNKDIIIIAQTAYAMLGDKEKVIEAGCNDYISKPTSKELLLEMINKHLG